VKDEYDFKGSERGKFYREGATLVPPLRLEADVLQYLLDRATARGMTLEQLVNDLLRKDIELIEAAS
jgi:hypothetical protein